MFELFLFSALAIVFFIVTVINASVVQSVKRLSNTDELFEYVSAIDDVDFDRYSSSSRQWAEQNGFSSEGYFLLHSLDSGNPIQCASWWSAKYRTYFLFYYAEENNKKSVAHDFATEFSDDSSLTTATDINGLLLPRLKPQRMQYVNSNDLEFVMKAHLRSVNNICNKQGCKISGQKGKLVDIISSFLKQQAELTMQLPLWKYRGAYWFFIKKYFLSLKRY